MQVGADVTVIKVTGRYVASAAGEGTLTVKELSGRNPATYKGTVTGGDTLRGRLELGGKSRGALELKRQ